MTATGMTHSVIISEEERIELIHLLEHALSETESRSIEPIRPNTAVELSAKRVCFAICSSGSST